MLKTYLAAGLLFTAFPLFAQEPETADTIVTEETTVEDPMEEDNYPLLSGTFKATRIINGHSTETLNKGELEFRVEHRFGDFAGSNGGVQQWFGLDNSSDIRIALEYGLTDKLMIGVGRSKGTGRPYRSLLDGLVKMKIAEQGKSPVAITALGMMTYTYMKASTNEYDVAYFPEQAYRFAYATQINISRQVTRRFSAAVMPTFVYRNYVAADDVNALFALGGAVKYGITKQMGIILEYYHSFHDADIRKDNMQSFGVAVEWITFGHTFTVNLTNSKGFGETQFIPYTYENWLKGQFRLGFTIGRIFTRG